MKELKGKTAVITGAASGIGLALTKAFVEEGMKVVMADVDEDSLASAATELEKTGAEVLGVLCDVSDSSSVNALAEATVKSFGPPQVLCNNAGIAPAGPILNTTPEEWQWTVGVNVLGVAYGTQAFAPLMLENGEGHIINTASQAGLMTTQILGMYCATKHAVVGFSESLYRELEDTPVGVSCLCPEFIKTAIADPVRLRPDWVKVDEAHDTFQPLFAEALYATGLEPSVVSLAVVEAIKMNKFWIFTHDTTVLQANRRFEDINAGRNPSPMPPSGE